jgi:ComF family protein
VLIRAIRKVRDGLVASAYPERCRVCGHTVESYDDGVACRDCWLDPEITRLIADPMCAKCAAPLRAGGLQYCGSCQSLPFSVARACGIYSGAIEASILFLKSQPHVCRRLREIIIHTYSAHSAALACDVVMPVPLNRVRERERGFNQARVVSKIICSRFHLKLDDRSLVRVKHTEQHRAGLDAKDRARPVAGAFEVARPERVKGMRVLLVDDVFTTGSTLAAAARTLLENGAAHVGVFAIARVEKL